MTENALVLSESTALSAYANREDVRELGDRLLAMHPAAAEVGQPAMRAAAQLAILLGANPLPGVNEVHIWKDDKGRSCMSLGINYWRRKAEDWGGFPYQIRPRPMNAKEMQEYNIAAGTAAAICKGVRTVDMIRFRELGFTTNEIWEMCGRTGVGTQGPNEYAKKGRPSIWSSLKRAETDMLRQLFPAEFAAADRKIIDTPATIMHHGEEDEVIEAEVIETEDAEETRPYTLADANADFFDIAPVAQPANGKPASTTTPPPDDGPLSDDEQAISEADDFVNTAAAFLSTDATTIKKHMATLKLSSPRKPAERVKAYRALKAPLAAADPAAQDALFDDDPDAVQAALATLQGKLD